MSTQPTPLTRESFLKMTPEELKAVVADPQKLAEANAILSEPVVPVVPEVTNESPVQTPEEIAAIEAVKVEEARLAAEAASKAEEERKAAEKAVQQEAYKAAGVHVETDADGNITKIVKTYQAKDDAGNPIGRPTYLEAKTWLELSSKQEAAHVNAVRFAERVKKQKLTVKKEDPNQPQPLSETELVQLQEELKGEDREKAAKAAERIRSADAEKAIIDAREAKASFAFLTKHIEDYNRCEANNKLLSDYVRGNGLEWTEENLEAAFIALESQLALKEVKEQPAPPVPANPAPVTPAPVAAPPAPAAPPVAPAPQNPPAPPAPRPGVNAGLVPGQQSAPRPTNQVKGLTKADIKAMSTEEYKRRLKDPKFVSEVNALLAKR